MVKSLHDQVCALLAHNRAFITQKDTLEQYQREMESVQHKFKHYGGGGGREHARGASTRRQDSPTWRDRDFYKLLFSLHQRGFPPAGHHNTPRTDSLVTHQYSKPAGVL